MRKTEPPTKAPDFVLKVQIDNSQIEFYVHKRPYLDYFLSVISQWYDLVVFTASLEIYGTLVADKLDPKRNIFRQRYFRQHCTLDYGSYTKDLSAINPDLSSIFILGQFSIHFFMFGDSLILVMCSLSLKSSQELINNEP